IGTRRAIIVPRRAIITRYGIDYVTLAGSGNSASLVPVQIAPTDSANGVEILSGVVAGDIVIAPRPAAARP
ncbi:MAG: efflux transporter periplasmic adaptor subunit, partial [Sphingopyxis sp.]